MEYTQYGAKTEVIWPSLESELHLLFCHNLILVLGPLCLIESIAAGTPAQFCGSRHHNFTWETTHIQAFPISGLLPRERREAMEPSTQRQKQPTKKKMARWPAPLKAKARQTQSQINADFQANRARLIKVLGSKGGLRGRWRGSGHRHNGLSRAHLRAGAQLGFQNASTQFW